MATQILLNPIGSGGDVFPYLALGQELQNRGHHVAVMTNPEFKRNVGQANLEFISIGSKEALHSVGSDPDLHRSGNAWKLALRWGAVGTMRETYHRISERIEKCDTMVLAPPISLGARLAAEKHGIPLATVVLSPFLIRSAYQCPIIRPMLLGDWVPRFAKQFQFWFADRFVVDPILSADVDSLRGELGLPPQRRLLHRWCFSNDLVLAAFWDSFAAPQPDWPRSTAQTGPLNWDPPIDELAFEALDQFIARDLPPVVLMAGSAGPGHPDFYRDWMGATASLNRQLIILEKNPKVIPKKLPDHVFHASYVPIDRVVARAALIAHSGSVGATLRSLAAGVPQLIFPRVNDQPDNAARARQLGVARALASHKLSERRIFAAVKSMLHDTSLRTRCQHAKAAIPDQDSIKVSCDLIESAFNRHRR